MNAWLRSHRAALAEALARLARQPLAATLSAFVTGLTLALPATGIALFENLASVAAGVSGKPEISLFLKDGAGPQARQALEGALRGEPAVASIQFIAKAEARAELAANGLADVLDTLPENPLPDAYVVTLKEARGSEFEHVRARFAGDEIVEHAQADDAWVNRLEAVLRLASTAMYLLGALLGAALVIISFNTIRLQILTRREEIEVSQILGATPGLIRRPFYWFGGTQGALGGCAALGVAALLLGALAPAVGQIAESYGAIINVAQIDLQLALATVGFSTGLGFAGTAFALRKYL
jgi:cell division transport system permease protein